MNEDLQSMNAVVKMSTEINLMKLEDMLADPTTITKAEVWYPKAALVNKLSNDMIEFLGRFQSDLETSVKITTNNSTQLDGNNKKLVGEFVKNNADLLYDKMIGYKKSLMEIDPQINNEFRNTIVLFQSEFDKKPNAKTEFSKWFFDDLNARECLAVLNHFKNNVTLIAYRLICFCNETFAIDRPAYDYFSAIVSQSSTIIRKGEAIEITAGVGAFSKTVAPNITIDGNKVKMSVDGRFSRVLPKAQTIGKHHAMVEIEYKDIEGKDVKIEKKIEYTVVD